jgi:diaminohydroxyphosphoribosylaminopyrimidine deaminase / 5-amino-6-(5-phosphoribosylamino)uracil reductase
MRRALGLAARGRGGVSPNPMVGATIVAPDGTIVGDGWHRRAGGPHAEVHALEEAGSRARGATLLCTLEPCCHRGRTGPCVERIVAAGIAKVVAATADPNPRVNGAGFRFLEEHGVRVTVGVGAARARRLNAAFFTWVTEGRPWVVMKAAASLDGYVSAAPGMRTELSGRESRLHAQRLRAELDAIAIGSGTVLTDDPILTVRDLHRARPLTRVLFDRSLRTPVRARILDTLEHGPVWVVTTPAGCARPEARALEARGAQLVAVDGGTADAFRELGRRGLTSLLLEGGPTLHAAAWEAGMIDHVVLYVAPRALGTGVPLADGRGFAVPLLEDRVVRQCGPDVIMGGYVHGLD